MRDAPAALAAAVVLPFLLGLALRWKGVVVAMLGLPLAAVVLQGGNARSSQLVGAAVLGAAGGLALGWAGALVRRGLRRRGPPPPRRGER